ncbi:NAD(P)-dependent dehydrogenase (short-subunit alcohol dehydrogenase family) [Rhodococcus sp. PvR044]
MSSLSSFTVTPFAFLPLDTPVAYAYAYGGQKGSRFAFVQSGSPVSMKPSSAAEATTMSTEHTPHTINYPGETEEMAEEPHDEMRRYRGRGLLEGKKALITGGDSGIGRAVAVAFAKEGADVAIAYLEEERDAEHTTALVAAEGRTCARFRGDLAEPAHCRAVVEHTVDELGALDILVNNVAYQNPVEDLAELSDEQWRRTFAVNIDSYFHVTKAALNHLPDGGSIINTSSINGLRGNRTLIDYSATKGAVIALTYALAQALLDRGIRVNCVAPGPVWTPLIPATMSADKVAGFGSQAPFGRAAQPDEIAPSYVFFASCLLSSYYSGEVLAPIGGETLPG